MQSYLHPAALPLPVTFRYSLDWRFLLPGADARTIHVLSDEDGDFDQALEQVGILPSKQFPFLNFEQVESRNIRSLVLPFGLSRRWVDAKMGDQIEFYRSLGRLIDSGGCFLIGFNNIWNFSGSTSSQYHSATPRRIAFQLEQAGFKSIKSFGAIPNLKIPEYIFEIESRAIHFALYHRYRQKPMLLRALRALACTAGLHRISDFFPSYFVFASV